MKNIGDFYRSATIKKIRTVIACKRNRFDFWNSCKRLQNFVNVEALVLNQSSSDISAFLVHPEPTILALDRVHTNTTPNNGTWAPSPEPTSHEEGAPQGFWGSGENGYLFSGS